MDGGDGGRQVDAFRRRLEAMELDCRDGPGGRSLLVRLTARGGPLPTPTGDLAVPQFVFATVGANRIKCMVPRALFFLPLIGIADCDSPGAIEARIRQAWRERQNELGQTRQWLEKLGCDVKHHAEVPVAFVEIGAADRRSELAAAEPGAVMLPSAGPLSELTLERAEDRIFRPEADLDTAVDLETLGRSQPAADRGGLLQHLADEGVQFDGFIDRLIADAFRKFHFLLLCLRLMT